MPGDMITVLQLCSYCGTEAGRFEVKWENMMLSSKDEVWCPDCGANRPEKRDIAGRLAGVDLREVTSLPMPAALRVGDAKRLLVGTRRRSSPWPGGGRPSR